MAFNTPDSPVYLRGGQPYIMNGMLLGFTLPTEDPDAEPILVLQDKFISIGIDTFIVPDRSNHGRWLGVRWRGEWRLVDIWNDFDVSHEGPNFEGSLICAFEGQEYPMYMVRKRSDLDWVRDNYPGNLGEFERIMQCYIPGFPRLFFGYDHEGQSYVIAYQSTTLALFPEA